jgi:hypothetical protein
MPGETGVVSRWRVDPDGSATLSGGQNPREAALSTTEQSSDRGGAAHAGETHMRLEVSTRVGPVAASYTSARDLAKDIRRAVAAHAEHEKRIGEPDTNWPERYAVYMVADQAGTELRK